MSLLNYFQKLLPDTPNVASVSSELTSRETEEVSKELKKMQDKRKKRKKCCVWTPKQRLEIGEHASLPGHCDSFLQSIRVWQSNLLLSLTRASKRVLIFQKGWSWKAGVGQLCFQKKTVDTISALRLRGATVTSSVINAVAKGIVQANNRTLLLENGGHLSLSNDWERRFYIVWTPLDVRWLDVLQPPPEFLQHQHF